MERAVLMLMAGCSGILLAGGLLPIRAEEGMYPLSELPRLNLVERGIELKAEEIFNPDQVSLVDGICRVNGCTGSFVSADGLILTNHHCAFDAIQKASTSQRDLLQDGFIAADRSQEIPASDYVVRITENYRDVSSQVLSVVEEGMSYSDRTRALDRRRRELEQAAERDQPGLRAEVAEMFAGRTYVLFLYTFLRDVRLVFAPPASIGNFGGDVDNWEWPRHTGDFSFMRAYTAPDGSPAAYSAENIPFRPRRFIQVAADGVREHDAVFLLGYPGRTARHKTASFLRHERDVRLPMIIDLYQWQIDVMDEAGANDRDVAIRMSSRSKSLANVEKRSRGQLQGLQRAKLVEARLQQEAELKQFIQADAEFAETYGTLLQEIDAVYAEITAAAALEMHLEQLRSACRAAAFAWFAYDSAMERAKPDLERESAYTDRNFPQSRQQMLVALTDWHAPTDVRMLSGMLERLSDIPEAAQKGPLTDLLQNSGRLDNIAQQLISHSQLADSDFFGRCLEQSPEELQQHEDPILKLIISLYPVYLQIREADKEREGRLSRLYGSLIDVKQQFLAIDFVPDANATLRMTCGRIREYSPADAVIRRPISTLRGVIEKTTGVDPFVTPDIVLQKYTAGEFGRFLHADLGQIPVAILYDTDTTGGNSGSPVLNAKGQLVGVNFDRCFEATINDFAWNEAYSRSIGVDIRYVLWLTGIVYDATHLLDELGVTQ